MRQGSEIRSVGRLKILMLEKRPSISHLKRQHCGSDLAGFCGITPRPVSHPHNNSKTYRMAQENCETCRPLVEIAVAECRDGAIQTFEPIIRTIRNKNRNVLP